MDRFAAVALADFEVGAGMDARDVIGILFIVYGLTVGWWRALRPQSLFKYAAMQKRWGESRGRAVHTIVYTIIPLLFGLFLFLY